MEVGDLLELERTLEGYGIEDSTAQKERVGRLGENLGALTVNGAVRPQYFIDSQRHPLEIRQQLTVERIGEAPR